MEVNEVKEETEEELRYAMDKLLRSLEKFKVVLENMKNQLKNPNSAPESSLKNITRYIKSIEGISQLCDNEEEVHQCKTLIGELTGSLLTFIENCIGEIKSSNISLDSIDNGRFEKALSYYKLTPELFTEKNKENS